MKRDYIKLFAFEEKNRSTLEFSDSAKIRLNPSTNRIELLADDNGYYPLDEELYVKLPTWTFEALSEWRGFHIDPFNQPDNTSIRFRINDGIDDLWWNGSTWIAASNSTDWNTEEEALAHIDSFPRSGRNIQFIINLQTQDKKVTPYVTELALLIEVDIDYIASLVGDSLVPSLDEYFDDLIIDFALIVDSGGDHISMLDIETPFNIVDIVEVYNHSADPEHLENIFSSFDEGYITTSSNFGIGETAWIRVRVKPEIYVNWSSQDYIEIKKIPAVVIERIDVSGNHVYVSRHVRNRVNGDAVVIKKPYKVDVDITISLIAEKNRTLFAMKDRALSHVSDMPILRWKAICEDITIHTVKESNFKPRQNLRDEHTSTYSLTLKDVYLWLTQSEQKKLINGIVFDIKGKV